MAGLPCVSCGMGTRVHDILVSNPHTIDMQRPHMKHVDTHGRIKLPQILQEVRAICKNRNHIRLLLVFMGLSLVWIVCAKLIVPLVIESAYRGESWSFLNRMILGQAQFSVSHYLQKWDKVIITGLLSGLGFYLIVLIISSPAFFRRFVGEATPGSLGAIRMWTCIVLLLTTSLEDLASIALLPVEMRQYGGAMRFLYSLPLGFAAFVTNETALRVV